MIASGDPGIGDEGRELVDRDLEFADGKSLWDRHASWGAFIVLAAAFALGRAHHEFASGEAHHIRAIRAIPKAWMRRRALGNAGLSAARDRPAQQIDGQGSR